MAVLIVIGSCATGKKAYVAKEDEEYYGAWVAKEEIPRIRTYLKIINNPDGTCDYLHEIERTEPISKRDTGTFTIKDKWTDTEGNIWYKVIIYRGGSDIEIYELNKISNFGNTLEIMTTTNEWPTEIDPNHPLYEYMIY